MKDLIDELQIYISNLERKKDKSENIKQAIFRMKESLFWLKEESEPKKANRKVSFPDDWNYEKENFDSKI